jgi:hypothetical protein
MTQTGKALSGPPKTAHDAFAKKLNRRLRPYVKAIDETPFPFRRIRPAAGVRRDRTRRPIQRYPK